MDTDSNSSSNNVIVSKCINAKIELSIAIEEISQISEQFLQTIHNVDSHTQSIPILEEALDKARCLVGLLRDIFPAKLEKDPTPPHRDRPRPVRKRSALPKQSFGEFFSNVANETEHNMELVSGLRDGSIWVVVDKVHRQAVSGILLSIFCP